MILTAVEKTGFCLPLAGVAVCSRRKTCHTREDSREVSLVAETALERNLSQRQLGILQELPRMLYLCSQPPLMRWLAELRGQLPVIGIVVGMGISMLNLPHTHFRQADVPDLAFCLQIFQGAELLLGWNIRVDSMQLI